MWSNYKLIEEIQKDEIKYYVSFVDVNKEKHTIEVEEKVFEAMSAFIRKDRALARSDARHLERIHLSEGEIMRRQAANITSLEESIIIRDTVRQIYDVLTEQAEPQKSRYALYILGFSTREIAEIEGISEGAARKSIRMVKNILKKFKD